MVRMTFEQFERLRLYLDRDAQTHIETHGKWRLDSGKLTAALEWAGVVCSDDPDPVTESILTDAKYAARQLSLYADGDGAQRALDAVERIIEECEKLSSV